MYSYKLDINTAELDKVLDAHPLASIYQRSAWCLVKEDWGNYTIGIYKDDVLVGGAYVLKRKVVLNYTLGYICRGPLIDFENTEETDCFFKAAKELARREHMISIKFDPNIFATYTIEQKEEAKMYRNDGLVNVLKTYGCKHLGYNMDMYDATQPRMQVTYPLAYQDVDTHFPKKTRDKLKIAAENHIEVEERGVEAVHEFTHLIELTESRKGIMLRPEGYFKRMMEAFDGNSKMFFAYANLEALCVDLEAKQHELQAKLASLDEVAVKKIEATKKQMAKCEREYKEAKQLMASDGKRPLIAAVLLVNDATTTELLYSGLNGTYRKFYAPYALRKAAILDTFNAHREYFNFGGVECEFDGGLFEFKSGFHPDIRAYVGEFDFITHPLLFKGMNLGIHAVKRIKLTLAKKG